jgi:CBS domain-containing protein
MTSPAIAASEETDVADVCLLMSRLGVHRIPIVRDGRVTGIVSSIDVCRAVVEGSIAVPV